MYVVNFTNIDAHLVVSANSVKYVESNYLKVGIKSYKLWRIAEVSVRYWLYEVELITSFKEYGSELDLKYEDMESGVAQRTHRLPLRNRVLSKSS